jgi:hypothetical protein
MPRHSQDPLRASHSWERAGGWRLTVEAGALVAEAVLAGAELAEVALSGGELVIDRVRG